MCLKWQLNDESPRVCLLFKIHETFFSIYYQSTKAANRFQKFKLRLGYFTYSVKDLSQNIYFF